MKSPEFSPTAAHDFVIGDLRDPVVCRSVVDEPFDEVYQLAADMGGAGFVFTGENDADIMHNSALINLNMLEACHRRNVRRIFYSSSACMYPEHNQLDPDNPNCAEDSAYPAQPDSEYGWEKLFSERQCRHRLLGLTNRGTAKRLRNDSTSVRTKLPLNEAILSSNNADKVVLT